MLLRKLSQSLKMSMALVVAMFSSGLLAPAASVGALYTGGNTGSCTSGVLLEKYEWDEDTSAYILDSDSDGTSVSVSGTETSGSFTAQTGYTINQLIVKGGNGPVSQKFYNYNPSVTSGVFDNTTLENDGGNTPGISNLEFCGSVTPSSVAVTPAVFTAPTCDAPGTIVGTDTDDYTFVRTGADTAAVLTATPVGDVTLTGQLVFGPYDLTQLAGERCDEGQTPVNPLAPMVTDICGANGDGITLPQNSDQITYGLNGNVVTATLVNPDTHEFGTTLNGYVVAENGLTATYTATFPNDKPCVTVCPVELDTIHSTNQDMNGWTLVRGAEYVDGGMKLTTPGDWVSGKISRDMSGTLGDLGDVISYSPDTQYLGLHIQTSEGWLTYESIYGGNLWLSGGSENMMSNAPHTGGGQGSPYYGTLEEWATAFPELEVLSLVVLYTNSSPASVTVTSVTIGCVEYTFDKEDVVEDSTSVTLCHATGSEKNPFVRITVSAEGAFNGHLGDGHHNGEDIIPFFTYNGETHSQNWTEGMVLTDECDVATEVTPAEVRFLNPTCENPTGRVVITATEGVTYKVGDTVVTGTISYPGGTSVTVTAEASDESYVFDEEATTRWSHTFTAAPTGCVLGDNDVCPNIEGTQSVVPTGMIQNTMTGECFTPGGRGGVTPAAQVLGASTQALPETLPSTGGADSPLAIIIASILAYGAAYFLQGRRLLGRKEVLSA